MKPIIPALTILALFILMFTYSNLAHAELAKIDAEIGEMHKRLDLMASTAKPIETTVLVVEEPEPAEGTTTYLGTFTATAYCPCEICCGKWSNPENPTTASGTRATEGRTVGADWAVIPAGTVIEIEGVGERTVEDKGADWISKRYNGMYLDVFFDSHKAAQKFGKRTVEVWTVK